MQNELKKIDKPPMFNSIMVSPQDFMVFYNQNGKTLEIPMYKLDEIAKKPMSGK